MSRTHFVQGTIGALFLFSCDAPICHPERSETESRACPEPQSNGDLYYFFSLSTTSIFIGVKSLTLTTQIPPLRYATVGMTNFVALKITICIRNTFGFAHPHRTYSSSKFLK